MKVTHGVTFQTPGNVFRKEYLDGDTEDYPEASHLDLSTKIAYTALRLEQHLLYIRMIFGNLDADQYAAAHAGIDGLCVKYLEPREPAAS